MKLNVNGAVCEVIATTLAQVLNELGFTDAIVATAVNGEFVPIAARADWALVAGDRIEILAPMQGG